MRYVIAGNGVAAVKAVESIRREDRAASLVVLGREGCPAYSPILTTYLICGEVPPADAYYRASSWYERLDVEFAPGAEVVKVDGKGRAVVARDGRRWPYDRLLVATGASPLIPQVPGAGLAGVFGLRTLADALRIRERLRPAVRAVVVGGGLVACKAAEALCRAGAAVQMIVSSGHLLSRYLDGEPAGWIARRAEAQGVRIRCGAGIVEVLGTEGVEGVRTDRGERVPCELVIFGKGVRPNIGMLDPGEVPVRRGVLVDRCLRTGCPDIFAAGDVTESENVISGESEPSAIWPAAIEQGAAAGRSMSGQDAAYTGTFTRNVFHFFGIAVAFAGLIRPAAEGHRAVVFRDPQRLVFRRLILDECGRVAGFAMLGDLRGLGRTVASMAGPPPRKQGHPMPVWRETYV